VHGVGQKAPGCTASVDSALLIGGQMPPMTPSKLRWFSTGIRESHAFPQGDESQINARFHMLFAYPRGVAVTGGPALSGNGLYTPDRTADLNNLSPPTGELPTDAGAGTGCN